MGASVTQRRRGAHLPSYVQHSPAHSFGRDTSSQEAPVRAMKHIPPNAWCSHPRSSELSITPMFPGAALRCCKRPCPTEPDPGTPPRSVLRSRQLAAGRADRPSPLTQRASAHTCPKQQGHAAEPRCGSSGVQRNECAKEGWAGLNLRHQSAGSKGQCSRLSMTEGFTSSQYGNHPSLRLSCSFSVSHPIPAPLK